MAIGIWEHFLTAKVKLSMQAQIKKEIKILSLFLIQDSRTENIKVLQKRSVFSLSRKNTSFPVDVLLVNGFPWRECLFYPYLVLTNTVCSHDYHLSLFVLGFLTAWFALRSRGCTLAVAPAFIFIGCLDAHRQDRRSSTKKTGHDLVTYTLFLMRQVWTCLFILVKWYCPPNFPLSSKVCSTMNIYVAPFSTKIDFLFLLKLFPRFLAPLLKDSLHTVLYYFNHFLTLSFTGSDWNDLPIFFD